jgi:nitroimidazol reductase NimA-like FMN-containing flavoprotein (pyridoxamine 5'-phosphate oxidase superfamily)
VDRLIDLTTGLSEDLDDRSLAELTEEECLVLLAAHHVGRLAVVVDGGSPLVVPVNFALDGRVVVFRSGPGAKLAALGDRPVSFQIDEVDPYHRIGWSVLVRGRAHEATRWEVEHVSVQPWVGPGRNRWFRIEPVEITGRRIELSTPATDGRGYL